MNPDPNPNPKRNNPNNLLDTIILLDTTFRSGGKNHFHLIYFPYFLKWGKTKRRKIGTHSVHVGSRKKDQLTKLVICESP